MDFDKSHGAFDYIIAHGIYSRVPANAQETILALCARLLTANGVALVSYNNLPGWHMLAIVRDAMLYQTCGLRDNLRHELITLDEPMRRLLPLIDCTRTHEQLAALRWPDLPSADRLALLQTALAAVAMQAFLVR